MKKFLSLFLVVALLGGLLAPTVFAAPVSVTSYSDLAVAIAAAPTDGTVTTIELENSFSATGGAIAIAAGQNIVLTSVAGSTFTFTQATTGQRHFSVTGNLTLQNVTLSGPGGTIVGGGVDVLGGTLTIESGGTITNSRAPGGGNAAYGGAVHVSNQGSLIMNDGLITNNTSSWAGGGVLLEGNSTFTMTGGIISGNTASSSGGGVEIRNGYGTISGGMITGNVATSAVAVGGGVELKAANLTMTGGLITNNRTVYGGGIHTDASGLITISGGTISNNTASGNGGGIFSAQNDYSNPLHNNVYNNLIIGSNVVFTGNVAGNGARIPPPNVATSTQIQSIYSSIFNSPLNNSDINYYNSGAMIMSLTVTFDPGTNGTFTAGTQTQQSIPTTNSPLVPTISPIPQPNANYGFIGWSSDGGVTVLTSAQVLTTLISDNTAYVAQYAAPITLTFDAQGGTPATQAVTSVQVTGTYANALSQVVTPTQTGYIFRGWFTTPNGDNSGVQILNNTVVTTMTNQTLYAHWIAEPTVTITFDANDGTPPIQVVPSRVIGDTFAATLLAIATPTLPGYTFMGWYDAQTGGTEITNSSIIPATDTTYYAQWAPIPPINVTFNAQGGTPDGQQQILETGTLYGPALSQVQVPSKMGYAFSGWFTTPDGDTSGVQILPTTVVTETTDQILYAHWVSVTVTIIFDAQGGSPATQTVGGQIPLSTYASALNAITTPTLPGYIFNGWHDQPQGMGGSTVSPGYLVPPYATTVYVYAWWTPEPTINVTFDAQGGAPDGQTATVTVGGTYAAAFDEIANPSLAGYIFNGWFTEPSGTLGAVQILDTTTVTATADQTLYAHWIVDPTLTITFDANGGDPATQVVSGNAPGSSYAPILASVTEPTQLGFVFQGWFDAQSGGTQITDSSSVPSVDTMLYAQWAPVPTITVTFDAQGGYFNPADIIPGAGTTLSPDQTLAYHEPVTIGGTFMQAMSATADPTPPSGNYYYFGGWWTTPNGDTSGVQVLPTSIVWDAPDGITLYVHWDITPTVTLTFDSQGGSPATQVRRGAVVGMEVLVDYFIQPPTLPGYTFMGWYDAQTGGTEITNSSIIPATDTTYYAQWAPIPPINVTFNAQGGTPDGQQQILETGTLYGPALSQVQVPSKMGYAFSGWFTTPDGDTSGVQILPTTVVTATTDQILYAHWVSVTVTIIFDAQGGSPATQTVGGQIPLSTYASALNAITTPTLAGYIFNGWHDQPQGMGGSTVSPGYLVPPYATTVYVYAWWTPEPTINVTFDAQGGAPDGQTATVTVGGTYAAAFGEIANPSLAGYVFNGWFTGPSGTLGAVQILDTTTVTATADQTLYARWIADPTVTITFDANGGDPTTQVVSGNAPNNSYAPILASVSEPTQTDFVFQGWFDAQTGGTQITDSSSVPSADTTLYAQWAPVPTITVTFDAQGGTPATQTVTPVQVTGTYASALSQVATPTQFGYIFAGWFTTPNGDTSGVQILDTTIVTATADQTLYAHWIADPTVTITFDANGGTPAIQVVSGKIIGGTYAVTLASVTEPTQEFYTFLGWFDAPTGGVKIADADIIPATNTTLYAQWAPLQINIIFDSLGATPAMQEEPAISGNTYEAPFAAVTTPIMADSDFVGWFTQIIGGTQVQPADIVTATADQTLYAQWAPLPTVTITFDGNGGTPTPLVVSGNVVGSSYASILASVTEPTQTGFVFQGWFDAQTGGTQITDLSNVPSIDTTLYAQWAPELPPPPPTITVTFDANGGAPATQTASVTVGGTYQSAFNVITTPTRAGHTFLGWFTNANGGTRVLASSLVTQTSDHTLYAHWTANQNPGFNDPVFRPPIFIDSGNREPEIQDPGFRQDVTLTEIHYSYLIGEGNNHIAPNDVITRAEVASILLRIVSDETRAAYWTLENPFSDVPNNGEAWFSNAISTANHKGIMTGFPDGTFRPNLPITRAEVVTVMTRFLHDEAQYRGTTDMFPYISDSWARNNINLAAQIGWIQGDQYGNFNPDANITRAEFATIVNRVLSRTATDIDTANMKTWIDNANTSAWFYWAMQIASNSSPQAPARNWAMLQLPNARAEDVII